MHTAAKLYCTQILDELALDAFAFFGLKNIRYCCNFTGTDGVYLFARSNSWFLSDARYQQQAQQQVQADTLICYQNKFDALTALALAQDFKRIGFVAAELNVAEFCALRRRGAENLEWVAVEEKINALRGIKTSSEIEALQQAADLNAKAFATIESLIKPGVSEQTLALELEIALRRLGGEERAFDFIVASGPRGALPHGVASSRQLASNELVTFDFGTRVQGYHSDETITLGVGYVPVDLRRIYDLVLEAHDLALRWVKPGLSLAELDAVAREHITRAGYGENFGHGLGHGVGLEIHEYPSVSSRGKDQLQAGMVITIEPGIYLPGRGGVRIEDTILVTADGYRCLTQIPKQYRAL